MDKIDNKDSAIQVGNLRDYEQPLIGQNNENIDSNKPTKCICKNDKCSFCNYYWKCICCNCTLLACSISFITLFSILLTVALVIVYLIGYFDKVPKKPLFCQESCSKWNSSNWNDIVNTYVVPHMLDEDSNIYGNMIDYCGIYNDTVYDKVIEDLANANIGSYNKNEQFAFYINAYNILAIKIVLDHPLVTRSDHACPVWVQSIRDITENGGLLSVWNIKAGDIGGQMYSLNNIEHDTLRTYWTDARVHSSVVCASLSCPNVRDEAYRGDVIDAQLNDQFREWMNNTSKGLRVIGENNETLKLSKIFDWYSSDFERNGSSVKQFVLKHIDHQSLKTMVENTKYIEYFEYNWNLNIE